MRWHRNIDTWFRAITLMMTALALFLSSAIIYGSGLYWTGSSLRIAAGHALPMNAANVVVGTALVYWCAKQEFNLWPRVPIIVLSVMIPAWCIASAGRWYTMHNLGLYFSPFLLACIALAAPYVYASIDENERAGP